jgi:hypothetical protein
MDLVGRVDEPLSPPEKRRKKNHQSNGNTLPVADSGRPGAGRAPETEHQNEADQVWDY